jgi:hypothetical protein
VVSETQHLANLFWGVQIAESAHVGRMSGRSAEMRRRRRESIDRNCFSRSRGGLGGMRASSSNREERSQSKGVGECVNKPTDR